MNTNYDINSKYITVKTSTNVKLSESFVVLTLDGPISLDVEIIADLEKIPQKYREVFLNVLTSKYANQVSFGDNPFSECKPIVQRKWWQFWKSKYFMTNL